MDRKLHNSLMAIVASASLLVLGLMTAAPVQPGALLHQDINLAMADQTDGNTVSDIDAQSPDITPRPRHRAQSVRMPFFSFAPRG